MKKILIVAAHPDDELLGIGGTAARHVKNGDDVYSLIMCEGESLRYGKDVGQSESTTKAAQILGIKEVININFPDQRLDTFTLTEIINPLEKVSERIKPNMIYCQFGGDINMDHKLLFEAANVAFRPIDKWLEKFYAFYTPSSTEWAYPRNFLPDTWVDISETIDDKIKAFECYKSEIRDYPHPRSIEAIRNMGAFFGNQCCMQYAEVFMTIRNIYR